MRYSIATLMIAMVVLSLVLSWAMYEKPTVGEFLYWEQNDGMPIVHPIKDASFLLYKYDDRHYLFLECNASPPEGGDQLDDNSKPHLRFGIEFKGDPKIKITEGARIDAKADHNVSRQITRFRYASSWRVLRDEAVIVNKIDDKVLDVTIVGNCRDSNLGRIAVHARFHYSTKVTGDIF